MMKTAESVTNRLKQKFLHLSLRKKIVLSIVGSSFAVLLLAVLASFFIELNHFKRQLLNEYASIAKILSSNLEAAVVFEDKKDSLDVLSALAQRGHIEIGVVYLEDGSVLAEYRGAHNGRGFELPAFDEESGIKDGRIVVGETVTVEDQVEGRVVLLANLDEVKNYLLTRGVMTLVFIAVTLFIAIILGRKLGDVLSRPILQLASTAQKVARDNDFSARQEKTSEDETGVLVDAFNEMLSEIEKQNELVTSNEARFRGYFESGIVGAGILDTNLAWKEANSRMTELLERDESTLVGLTLHDVIEDPFPGIPPSKVRTKVELGYTADCWVQGEGANRRYIRISLRCISGTKSHEEHVLILASDITDRKLHEEELLKEKEHAENLSKAKDEFLSVISHELRTPLNPIIGYVELMQLKSSGKELEQLNLVHDSAVHLLGLINDVLDFSRIERGPKTLFLEWFDYREVCEGVMELLEPEAASKGLVLTYHDLGCGGEAEAGLSVRIDGKRLRQILFNLVGNALKFTTEGRVEIRSQLTSIKGGKGRLRIEVEDTGIGIDESKRQIVFDPFSQVDTSLSRVHDGLGLGLAISRKIVGAMEGEIDFKSELGKGSCFWFEIPVAVSSLSKSRLKASNPLESGVKRGGKVLLVEDETVNREMAKSMLQELGQEVSLAMDGREALELIEKQSFDLIIMDVMMPRMNGLEAIRAIRTSNGAFARVPVVAVTAHLVGEREDFYTEAGFDGHLYKPYTMSKLAGCLSRWIKS